MTQITFYGGINEIGGTKIFIKNGNESIFLDFGKQHSNWLKYYEYPFSLPKTIDELITLELIPKPVNELENLYTRLFDLGSLYSIEKENETNISACIISHPHTDHIGHAFLLNRKIKLYLGEATYEIINARLDYSIRSSIEDRNEWYDKSFKNIITFRSERKLDNLDIEITPIAVDHSVPGSYGFLIDLKDYRIIYTGDFRWHGPARKLTSNFIDKIKSFDANLIICEGTQFSNINSLSEIDVENEASQLISLSKGLILVNISPLDIDRIYTFYKVAEKCNRQLVLNIKLAAILARLNKFEIQNYPDLKKLNVLYIERKRLMKWKKSFLAGIRNEKFGSKLSEREYSLGKNYKGLINIEELIRNSSEYILITSYYSYDELAELYRFSRGSLKLRDKVRGGIYIMSTSEPFEEEMEVKFEKLKNWIKIAGFIYYPIHSSGHIRPLDLKRFLSIINVKNIIPVHTDAPYYFENFIRDLNYNIIHPVKGETLTLN